VAIGWSFVPIERAIVPIELGFMPIELCFVAIDGRPTLRKRREGWGHPALSQFGFSAESQTHKFTPKCGITKLVNKLRH